MSRSMPLRARDWAENGRIPNAPLPREVVKRVRSLVECHLCVALEV